MVAGFVCAAASVALALTGLVPLASSPASTTADPVVTSTADGDLSRTLRRMAADTTNSAPAGNTTPNRPTPLDRIDAISAGEPGPAYIPDPTGPGSQDMPNVSGSFDGLSNADNASVLGYTVLPPDTDGDVGPNHYVQMVNSVLKVFDKSGNTLLGPVANNTIWSGFGGDCQNTNDGDPIVQYDQFANRWLVSQFSVNGNSYHECVAVSQTPDPTGAWYRYAFDYADFPDYPKFGVWPDGYYVTYNMFDSEGFAGTKICALERRAMLAGTPASQQCFDQQFEWSLLPSDADGTTPPPTGSPNYLLAEHWSAQDKLTMFKMHVDWDNPANTSLTGPRSIPVNAFTWACLGVSRTKCVPQKDTAVRLESLGGRAMYRLAYRNFGDHESLVVNHTVAMDDQYGLTSQTGIGWYELRDLDKATPTVYQQGTTADPDGTTFRYIGSLAQDKQGNMALGYSTASATTYPSIRYNGRLAGDPLNTMPQAENTIVTGGGAQTNAAARWGDYSAMHVDPLDDCTFWYTNEYIQATGSSPWKTKIASFKYPGCTGTATVPGKPTVTATAGNQRIDVDFSATNGGNPITGYRVTTSPGNGSCSTRVGVTTDPLTCRISGLTNGQAYSITVKATNAVGDSTSNPVSATPRTRPSAPNTVSAAPGNQTLAVTWAAPSDNGGSAIIDYTATATPDGSSCTTAGTGCTLPDLTNGQDYTVTVTARNAAGDGAAGTTTATPRTVPGTPRSISATPASKSVSLTWTAPSDNGGAPIIDYTATATPGGSTCTTTGTGCTVRGLANGQPYTFTVTARNAAGDGSGGTTAATPRGTPGAPTAVTATAGNAAATVTWTTPTDDGGSPISGYTVFASPGGMPCVTITTSCTYTGLTNGQAYTFTVSASNALGTGPASGPSSSVTPNAVPQTADVSTPRSIASDGKTVVLRSAVITNAGQQATARVSVRPKGTKYAKVSISRNGKITVRTTGKKKLRVALLLTAPATSEYGPYTYKRTWRVPKAGVG